MKKLFNVVIAAMLMASGSYAIAAAPATSDGTTGNTNIASGLDKGAASAVGVGAVALIAGVALISSHNDDNGNSAAAVGTGTGTGTTTTTSR